MGPSAADLTSRILRHERLIVAGSIALLVALGWWFLATGAGMPRSMGMAMEPPFSGLVAMWWLMMIAMMLPSAAPAILLYARVHEQRPGSAIVQPWIFALGYLAVWLMFSILAAATQRLIAGPSMALGNRWAESSVLIAAGIYQLTPLKNSCLTRCRSPAEFLRRHWRPGWRGALRLGVLHGADCVGCCWMLMALLFVGGVMNLLWIVALTLIVAVEKLLLRGDRFGRAAGVVLIAWGVVRIAG